MTTTATTPGSTEAPLLLRHSVTCQMAYKEYDPVGNLLAESTTPAETFQTFYDVSEELIDNCIEVCTVFNTEGTVFSSSFRTAGTNVTCQDTRDQYEVDAAPYNTLQGKVVHKGWLFDEVFNYTATTTVRCCTDDLCNSVCAAIDPPSLRDGTGLPVSAAAGPAIGASAFLFSIVLLLRGRRN